jgi:hypothetical protein
MIAILQQPARGRARFVKIWSDQELITNERFEVTGVCH